MDLGKAEEIQQRFRTRLKILPLKGSIQTLAGVDAAFTLDRVIGAACVFSFPDLKLLEEKWAVRKTTFPYIPGFLSFREATVIIGALKKLTNRPDVVLADGQGIAHPRRMGLASHLGILMDLPAIGCAKSRLVGDYQEPGPQKGDWSPLQIGEEIVGAVLRSRKGVKPLFVSPGHKINLADALSVTLQSTRRYRLPEPLRRADRLSKRIRVLLKTKAVR